MPNDPANDNADNEDGQGGKVPREHVRHLEEKAGKFDDVNEKYEALQRETAFLRAGVDTSTKAGAYLLKGYDGELTSEAIQAEATAMGLIGASEAAEGEDEGVSEEEKSFDDAASDASSRSPGDEQPNDHPSIAADKIAEEALKKGATREDALAASVSLIGGAAAGGDSRVIWTPGGNR